jgi:hypothetical protein
VAEGRWRAAVSVGAGGAGDAPPEAYSLFPRARGVRSDDGSEPPGSSPGRPSPGAAPLRPALRVLTCDARRGHLGGAAPGTVLAETDPDLVALQGRSARHELEAPGGVLRFVNLRLDSPRGRLQEVSRSCGTRAELLRANSDLRRRSGKVCRWPDGWAGPVLIAGDFNTPSESTAYRECRSRYANAFSSAGLGFGPASFTGHNSVRIDHIPAAPAGTAGAAAPAPRSLPRTGPSSRTGASARTPAEAGRRPRPPLETVRRAKTLPRSLRT